jgi:hypothetical protein
MASARSFARSFVLGVADLRCFGESEKHDLFAGDGADVVMHADDCDPGDSRDPRLQERSRGFEKMCAHAFEQVSALSAGSDFTKCCSAAVKTPLSRIKRMSSNKWARMSLAPRPMNSRSKRFIPSQTADSISPCVLMVTSRASRLTLIGRHANWSSIEFSMYQKQSKSSWRICPTLRAPPAWRVVIRLLAMPLPLGGTRTSLATRVGRMVLSRSSR